MAKDYEMRIVTDEDESTSEPIGGVALPVTVSKAALMDALSGAATLPDPYAMHPPFEVLPMPKVIAPSSEDSSGGAQYEVVDEQGNAEIYDTTGPNAAQPVPNAQLKAKLEAQARDWLNHVRKVNNRQAELIKRKKAKTAKRRKQNKQAKASRKRNR